MRRSHEVKRPEQSDIDLFITAVGYLIAMFLGGWLLVQVMSDSL